jgi:hypothetical protein
MLAVGAVFTPWPLIGARPEQGPAGVESVGVQQAEARLWQDPFSAAARHREKNPGDKREMAWLAKQADAKCPAGEDCRVAIVGVLLPGSPYVGGEEFRRRMRYAVISALGTAAYAPEDAEHIGYLEPGIPGLLPFEWHTQETHLGPGRAKRHILLLWLDEAALGQKPMHGGPAPLLARMQDLLEALPSSELHLIGPASSGTLQALLADKSAPDFALRLHWHSPFATLAPIQLHAGATSLEAAFAGRFGSFKSHIADDAQLAQALAGELAARGLDGRWPALHGQELPGRTWPALGTAGITVALVGQRDTAYARGLSDALELALAPYRVEILRTGYLRGVDGKQAGGKNETSGKNEKAAIERPEGDAQLDYLRRLAQDLLRRQAEFQRAGKPGIRAIGILGDDYHDKLLTLEAMSGAIPDAVFFTTDLDAAMLHPADNRYTRNLLVASGYGLSLAAPVQGDAPPFRDSYQTAAYATTRAVLAEMGGGSESPSASIWRQARLFEVGRSRFLALNETPGNCMAFPGSCANPQAAPTLAKGLWRSAWLLASLASSLVLLALLYPDWRRALRQPRRRRRVILGGTILAVIAAGFVACLPMPAGEPLGWVEGNSAWPSEFIRLGAGLLALCLLARAQANMATSGRRCMRRYFKGTAEEEVGDGRHRSTLEVWRCYLRGLGYEPRLSPLRSRDSRSLLRRALGRLDPPSFVHSARPYLFIISMFWALGLAVFMAYGFPHAPVRSFTMRSLDYGIVLLSISAFLWLLVYVLRATRHAITMARALAGETRWPRHSLARFGMPDAGLECLYDDWMDVQLLAHATEPVQRLIYYPFLILFLLFFAQSRLFDHWVIPLSLYLLVGFTLAVLLAAAWRLRRVAETVRAEALRRLARYRMQLLGEGEGGLVSQVDEMVSQIRGINVGVFATLSQQPLARAVLSFLSAISGLSLLEYVNLSGL